ncbi:MAG: DoxX family protein [Nanoarchaeota archaeon]|nr:DoxX family protein [Nanoarchaeota archaeon]
MKNYKEYAPILLRITISLVVIWFGINNIFSRELFLGYLPQYAYNLPIQPLTIILITGIFETIFGLLLIIGLFTRVASFLITIHILGIAFSLGYNDVAIRDFGLALATLAIFLHGKDKWCLDNKLKKKLHPY